MIQENTMIYRAHVFMCTNQKKIPAQCCANEGGQAYIDYLSAQLRQKNQFGPGKIRVSSSGCLGRCSKGALLGYLPASHLVPIPKLC